MTEDKFQCFLSTLGNAWEEGLREAMKIPSDHIYISERLEYGEYEKLIKTIGNENYSFVSGARTTLRDKEDNSLKESMRFSIFVSPQGVKNVLENRDKLSSK